MKTEQNNENESTTFHTGPRRRQVTINIEVDTMAYFQAMAAEKGLPVQLLISLYLTDCAKNRKQLYMAWQ